MDMGQLLWIQKEILTLNTLQNKDSVKPIKEFPHNYKSFSKSKALVEMMYIGDKVLAGESKTYCSLNKI